ncbi:site-specific integrase [Enterovibrio norvegicus]|uniref:site-specific integrase n=1 Tax=Enterovibrio norvegicus TaxID=188144 RepID=UPI0024B1BA0D|nr:site-specific integrase [Enterovibrio norvegicus]
MANIRVRPNGIIQYDLCAYGKRFRETSGLKATPTNLKKAKTVLKKINAELALGTFDYRAFFPNSRKIATFEALKRDRRVSGAIPYFDTYFDMWKARQLHRWKPSYARSIDGMYRRYLLPFFHQQIINDINMAKAEAFRAHLCELTNDDGERRLSNRSINDILVQLKILVGNAADEFNFPYPLAKLRDLKEQRGDPHPLSREEVLRFLEVVPPAWRDYFIVRFYTGMRSCEVHGLMPEHVDFEHGFIRVRQNWVNGELSDVKTPRSRRNIPMAPTVRDALERAIAASKGQFVFSLSDGKPLDTRHISKMVWYPTLEAANLSPRRPYQTRHTAAVLHLAAHENPLFVSTLLGHSSTRMLFEVYAPYVVNAARADGGAFEAMMKEHGRH